MRQRHRIRWKHEFVSKAQTLKGKSHGTIQNYPSGIYTRIAFSNTDEVHGVLQWARRISSEEVKHQRGPVLRITKYGDQVLTF